LESRVRLLWPQHSSRTPPAAETNREVERDLDQMVARLDA
jgi:hypothetical protein